MTKAEEYAKKRAATAKRIVELAKEHRDADQSLEADRPKISLIRIHGDGGYGIAPQQECQVLASVDNQGGLIIEKRDSVKAEAVRTKLIPWLIDVFGAPPPTTPEKKRRRATA